MHLPELTRIEAKEHSLGMDVVNNGFHAVGKASEVWVHLTVGIAPASLCNGNYYQSGQAAMHLIDQTGRADTIVRSFLAQSPTVEC